LYHRSLALTKKSGHILWEDFFYPFMLNHALALYDEVAFR
jgi:hypothetical protein